MDGLGLDNMLNAEQVEEMFSGQAAQEDTPTEEPSTEDTKDSNNNEDTAEVDFSDLFGNKPESVGSGETSEGDGETPVSNNHSSAPQTNLFSSIAGILRDKGVFPDLSDDALKEVKDEAALEKLFNDKVTTMLDARQQRIEKALNGGATTNEARQYQQAVNLSQFLESRDTARKLSQEDAEGEQLRKQVMYQDYINRGFKQERAVKLIEKSFADGNDIEDAKDALESCKDFYRGQIEDYEAEFEERKKVHDENEQQQYSNLKKNILDKDSFFGGVKVDKGTRQKAYDAITKPVYKDDNGNYMNALQKYQREHPMEFMGNVALLYALTDGFKSVDRLAKDKVKKEMKKGFAELESIINSSKRNGDGTLNLANTPPDDNRENWTLAV